ncbi:fibronectin type III domain-containing protein [Psychroserpens sp.]
MKVFCASQLKHYSSFIFFTISYLTINSQNIIVKPYLQNGGPSEMKIMWETDASSDGFVDWGIDESSLSNTITSTSIISNGANRIHTAIITGLAPDSKYYYQVRTTTGVLSSIYHFHTHPTKSSEMNINLVAMSDMQQDGSNPNVFETIVDSGVIPLANTNYANGIEDLEAILIPGDLVATGTYSSWRNSFFTPADGISPYVPIYPVPGNHEYYGDGVTSFLKYFNLPLNGSVSNPEEWWYKDLSNVRVIGLNSNSPAGDKTTQLNWMTQVLDEAGSDPSIDFVFAQLHHPYKSELWTPGELDFTGDVIALLETFSTTYNKPSIHFFGHTHAYSRGQSRDHNHLWVNVATAGGAIDNWGEFPNADYDEFVLSEDEYGFVMLEVEAGANPKFVLKRYSQGDQNMFENNTLSDEITIKRFNNAPSTPIGLFPNGPVSVSCLNFQATEFVDAGNIHQASHWQVIEGCDFNDPSVIDIWKQSANWYNEINTQLGDNLTDQEIYSLTENTNYCWRVRYRNANLTWSNWSTPLSFNTTVPNFVSGNLLLNGDAENGITDWTGDIETLTDNECGSVPVYEGLNFFAVGGVCANEQTTGIASQNIDITAYSVEIDAGDYLSEIAGYLRSWATDNDLPEMYVEFLDGSNSILGTSNSISNNLPEWLLRSEYANIPIGTRTIKTILKGTRNSGTDNDSYFDSLSIKLLELNCPTLGIRDNSGYNNIKIYPNPSKDKLFYKSAETFKNIIITDALGRSVLKSHFLYKESHIDITDLSEGMYIITFINDNAKQSFRFIKSN